MDKKGNILALCLLDSLEDENIEVSKLLIIRRNANPNTIILGRGIASIHYACGMNNVEMAEEITELMLKYGGDPNVRSDDNMTPLHVAAVWGRANIVKMLLEKNGDINAIDDDKKTPILYAIHECHFDVIKIVQNFVFESKIEQKKRSLLISANKINTQSENSKSNILTIKDLENNKLTPNRINYNFDMTSPYYINITHRKKDKLLNDNIVPLEMSDIKIPKIITTKKENLFELSETNLKEHSKNMSPNKSIKCMINTWRDKVQRSHNKSSILRNFNDIDALINGITTDESIDFTNTTLNLDGKDTYKTTPKKSFSNTSFGKLLERLKNPNKSISDISFVTAENNNLLNDSNYLKSPKTSECIIQMTEGYEHTDDENGIVFYEKKTLPNPILKETKKNNPSFTLNKSESSTSTNLTIPGDYDTDTLRAELTNFGEPPGPITSSTKRLYTKRLIKLKRNPETLITNPNANLENENTYPKFSIELEKTFRNKEWFQRILDYMDLEKKMMVDFRTSTKEQKQRLREGHLKTSFIYLLIDPRVSENLPGQSSFLDNHDVWKKFISSIFYVGKGKSSRPYSHLYDAMKIFSRNYAKDIYDNKQTNNKRSTYDLISETASELAPILNKKQLTDNKKLDRILDIWKSNKGVICLHVFHNIIPTEAYTREASIIDALSLLHLTNLRRGDYYGSAQTWPMRVKKFLGIALLYKAMTIFLIEGESQLLPSDLI